MKDCPCDVSRHYHSHFITDQARAREGERADNKAGKMAALSPSRRHMEPASKHNTPLVQHALWKALE